MGRRCHVHEGHIELGWTIASIQISQRRTRLLRFRLSPKDTVALVKTALTLYPVRDRNNDQHQVPPQTAMARKSQACGNDVPESKSLSLALLQPLQTTSANAFLSIIGRCCTRCSIRPLSQACNTPGVARPVVFANSRLMKQPRARTPCNLLNGTLSVSRLQTLNARHESGSAG